MAANKDGHYFENEIELGLDVYFKYKVKDEKSNVEDITRGIGHKDEHGNHKSFVPKKEGRNTGFLEFDMTDVGKDFVLLIKLNDIPVNKGYRGIQIFPGSVPIYRDEVLVGGIGISGDGIEQDDMIAFLAVDQAGARVPINNAPPHRRADTLTPQGTRLRYIQCPQAPFLGSDEQQPCKGK
jgi:hypothetical protein